MVRGLDLFRERFKDFEDRYVLVGDAAVFVAMEAAGIEFRVTKNLEIVLRVESLDAPFAKALSAFVGEGDYGVKEKGGGGPKFYKFCEPADARYPSTIEVFSRMPDPIQPPIDYGFVQDGIHVVEGLSVLTPEYLLPLKARAWIDLEERYDRGEYVSPDDIRKHRNDVIRLSQLISPADRVALPKPIRANLSDFVGRGLNDGPEPKTIGVIGMTLDDVQSLLGAVYGIDKSP
jgi:hypothetical protein